MSGVKRSSRLRATPQPSSKIGKSERTRAAILNAALDFLWSHPFREMTVQSVMAPTGLGRSALYHHFPDLHDLVATALAMLQDEIFATAMPWVAGVGDPVALTHESLAGLADWGYRRGPIVRAVADAAATDQRVEDEWRAFLGRFDDAASARIAADQEQGLIAEFDPRPVAIALNRLDAYTIIEAFGQLPRRKPKPVREALARIWTSTLYGSEWLGDESSTLVRK